MYQTLSVKNDNISMRDLKKYIERRTELERLGFEASKDFTADKITQEELLQKMISINLEIITCSANIRIIELESSKDFYLNYLNTLATAYGKNAISLKVYETQVAKAGLSLQGVGVQQELESILGTVECGNFASEYFGKVNSVMLKNELASYIVLADITRPLIVEKEEEITCLTVDRDLTGLDLAGPKK